MSDWFGRQPVKVVGGAGTTKDPRIVWLTHPPSELSRRLGNENVARSLGDYGYTHVWLRGCDHKTKTTKRAKMGTTTSVDDLHLTIYCRDEMGGNWHGHVYCVRERNGDWLG
ncbi:hypothetical protein CDV36_014171 [Fusarium kuroshium]|uniref:Uncharacterized protein n=1 Tax=Fusarium kuroshium TaxID=2010991 RepID=A0A3M2RIM2_9HYPO|nr:hypothetical protein CDV36_014171 [Fusarium kuroshium]